MWKLTNAFGCFAWNEIIITQKHKKSSSRIQHSGWEYEGKMWTFGGSGSSSDHYLNKYEQFVYGKNNQLLHYNPDETEWTNVKCFGTVPEPRSTHATIAINYKVWLYGGNMHDTRTSELINVTDLYELDMPSLTWTKINTSYHLLSCSLNVTTDLQLVLHAGYTTNSGIIGNGETCVLDISSLSWRQHSSNKVFPQGLRHHTGSLGINNSILIIGSSDKHKITCKTSCKLTTHSCVVCVMLEPKSLQQLAMKTVYENRAKLQWNWLPNKLIELMKYTKGDDVTEHSLPQEAD